ncbi:MAG: hypothetical protein RR482_02815, partial [Clostridia bacterium]
SGYACLINTEWMESPISLEALKSVPIQTANLKRKPQYALQCAAGGAALAFLSQEEAMRGGFPQGILLQELALPTCFAQQPAEKIYHDFIAGHYAACIVPVREARRFSALESAGKGFAYRAEAVPGAFTDLMLLVGRPKGKRDDLRARQADALMQSFFQPSAQTALYT